MKKILLLLFALFAAVPLVEAREYQDIVYLKSGSSVKGVIIEQTPEVSLKLQTSEGLVLTFQMGEVFKIVKDEPDELSTPTNTASKKLERGGGYRGFFDFAGAFPVSFNGYGTYSFQMAVGYQINPYFFLGAGLSVDLFFDEGVFSVPIYGDFRVNFLNKPITPFFDTRIGYSVYGGKGLYVNPNLGVSFGLNNRTALTFSVGYTKQYIELRSPYFPFNISHRGFMESVCFKLGVEF